MTQFHCEMYFKCCAIDVHLGNLRLCIICIYRSSCDKQYNMFYDNLYSFLNYVTKRYKNIILTGDLNIDMLRDTGMSRDLRSAIVSFGLKDFSDKPTRVIVNGDNTITMTKIDYIATSFESEDCHMEVYQPNIADHLALILNIDVIGEKTKDKILQKIKYRDISNDNLINLKLLLQRTDFSQIYDCADVDATFDCFMNILWWATTIIAPWKQKYRTNIKNTVKKLDYE